MQGKVLTSGACTPQTGWSSPDAFSSLLHLALGGKKIINRELFQGWEHGADSRLSPGMRLGPGEQEQQPWCRAGAPARLAPVAARGLMAMVRRLFPVTALMPQTREEPSPGSLPW